jgi:hypothetical protein
LKDFRRIANQAHPTIATQHDGERVLDASTRNLSGPRDAYKKATRELGIAKPRKRRNDIKAPSIRARSLLIADTLSDVSSDVAVCPKLQRLSV